MVCSIAGFMYRLPISFIYFNKVYTYDAIIASLSLHNSIALFGSFATLEADTSLQSAKYFPEHTISFRHDNNNNNVCYINEKKPKKMVFLTEVTPAVR